MGLTSSAFGAGSVARFLVGGRDASRVAGLVVRFLSVAVSAGGRLVSGCGGRTGWAAGMGDMELAARIWPTDGGENGQAVHPSFGSQRGCSAGSGTDGWCWLLSDRVEKKAERLIERRQFSEGERCCSHTVQD